MTAKSTVTQNSYRTHNCGELSAEEEGSEVRLSGWVQTRRDHGGLIFIDLRDKWGITQLTFDPSKHKDVHGVAETLRSEFVVSVAGTVLKRPDTMINKELITGEIEIEVSEIEIQSTAKTPPFEIDDSVEVNEELRLKYRFIDLRHPRLQKIMRRLY